MGIMDKIFRGKNKNEELNKEDTNIQIDLVELEKKVNAMNAELAASLSRKPEVDPFSEVATRINERNQSAAVQNIDNVVQEEAQRAKLEKIEKEFLETHADVEKFRKEFLHNKLLKEMGLSNSATQSPCMEKLEKLRSSKLVNDRYLGKIFLPYLIEKKALGIISDGEQQELNLILGKTGQIEDLKNATTVESYTLDFDNALIILGAIGAINIEDFTQEKIFSESNKTRDSFLSKSNMQLYSEVYYLNNNKKAVKPIDYCPFQLGTPECNKWMEEYMLTPINGEEGIRRIDSCPLPLETPEKRNEWIKSYVMNHIIEIIEIPNISSENVVKNALKSGITKNKVNEVKKVEYNELDVEKGKTEESK